MRETEHAPTGWDDYRASLIDAFPAEESAIIRVLDILRRVVDGGAGIDLLWATRPVTHLFGSYGLSPGLAAAMSIQPHTHTLVAAHAVLLRDFLQADHREGTP